MLNHTPAMQNALVFVAGIFCTLLVTTIRRDPPIHHAAAKPTSSRETDTPCRGKECIVLTINSGMKGGHGLFTKEEVLSHLSNKLTFDVLEDLRAFTGMSDEELMNRLRRLGRHHFSVEHAFFAPNSSSELAMYYRSSSAYVWANSIHPALDIDKLRLTPEDGPVLEYSGGVGSNVLSLASRGIKAVYFGIGMMEFEFARFRVQRHRLDHLVDFVRPYHETSEKGLCFDSFRSLKVGASIKEPLGAIFALDVFEHIPDYHVTARYLISLLRDGGKLYENSPFAGGGRENAIHLKASMPLDKAFIGMRYVKKVTTTSPKVNEWEKNSSNVQSSN